MDPATLFAFSLSPGGAERPNSIMRKLRDKITAHEVANEAVEHLHKTAECKKSSQKYSIKQKLFKCLQCYWSGEREYVHNAEAFGVSKPGEVLPNLLIDGAWTRCEHCDKRSRKHRCWLTVLLMFILMLSCRNRRWNMLRTLK